MVTRLSEAKEIILEPKTLKNKPRKILSTTLCIPVKPYKILQNSFRQFRVCSLRVGALGTRHMNLGVAMELLAYYYRGFKPFRRVPLKVPRKNGA